MFAGCEDFAGFYTSTLNNLNLLCINKANEKNFWASSKNRFAFINPIKPEGEITTTAKFQKMRKIQREVCELHQWTWDPSDPPGDSSFSSEEIHLDSSHGKQYIVDLLSSKKADLEEQTKKKLNERSWQTSSEWQCDNTTCAKMNPASRNNCVECDRVKPMNSNSSVETRNGFNSSWDREEDYSIGPIPQLALKTTTMSDGQVVHLIGQYVDKVPSNNYVMGDQEGISWQPKGSILEIMTQVYRILGKVIVLMKFQSMGHDY